MFWCNTSKATEIMKHLNGSKILIKGNHDNLKDRNFRAQFDHIYDYLETQDDNRNLILCHYPIVSFKNSFHGWYHFYGHVHNSFESNMIEHHRSMIEDLYNKPCNMINVGAMMPWIDYTPQTMDQILKGYESFRKEANAENPFA